jgi:hypothetical protein
MRQMKTLKPILALLAFAAPAGAATAILNPTSIQYLNAVNQELGSLGNETNLIDGSGLSAAPTIGNYQSVSHAAVNFGPTNAWVTTDPGGFPSDFFASGGLPQAFGISLGGLFSVESVVVWGYHFGSANGNSARQLTLDFSIDGGLSYVSSVSDLVVNTNAVLGGAAEATFGVVNANFIRATFTDNHFDPSNTGAGGDRLGIAEIRFTGGDPIPEPGSALLAGLGLMAASVRRRR